LDFQGQDPIALNEMRREQANGFGRGFQLFGAAIAV
jgi:hypothetical protein